LLKACKPHQRTAPLTNWTETDPTKAGFAQFESESVWILSIRRPCETKPQRAQRHSLSKVLEFRMGFVDCRDLVGFRPVPVPRLISGAAFGKILGFWRSGSARSFYPEKSRFALIRKGVGLISQI